MLWCAVGALTLAARSTPGVSAAHNDPNTWAAAPGHFCHAVTPSARVLNIETATHKQCADACAKIGCGCFDMSDNGKGTKASGACRGTMGSILHPSGDRTAYTNHSVPPPAPGPAPRPDRPSTWSQLWLDYRPINTERSVHSRSATFTQLYCGNTSADGILGNACAELLSGLGGMLGERPHLVSKITADNVLVLDAANLTTAWPPDTAAETFQIGSGRAAPQCMGHSCTLISGPSEVSVLYGVFHFLGAVRRDSPVTTGDAQPANSLRVWDLWDNVDGSVERGYAGRSVFDWSQLPDLLPRYRDYARLLASIGINAIVWNNVNACEHDNQHILEHEYAHPPVGVRTNHCSDLHLAEQTIGELSTSDPLDKSVVRFWKDKVAEIVDLVPSFRGFLAKADSEGQPGPMKYNRTEADGANLFGSVLDPLPHIGEPGVAIWRSFSHPNYHAPPPMNDQAYFQYQRFAGFDGQFLSNVVLQSKNGPFDFQVREPVHSLFGHMDRTNQMVEFEATQEYLGQAKHVCHLPTQWESYLRTNLAVDGPDKNTTLADVVSGGVHGAKHTFSGTAAVSNLGEDPNWTGHEFSAANTYGYGRLAWDPTLSAADVTREWVELTWSPHDDDAEDELVSLLLGSWEAFENYTAPLGVGFICSGDHYAPDPLHRQSYTNATQTHIGYDRHAYAQTYNSPVSEEYETLASTPDNLLLCFQNVPYTHKLGDSHGGLTVLEWIYSSHKAGAATAAEYVTIWKSLKGRIDASAYGKDGYDQVLKRLQFGSTEAARFSEIIVDYFANLTGVTPGNPQ